MHDARSHISGYRGTESGQTLHLLCFLDPNSLIIFVHDVLQLHLQSLVHFT